MSLRIPARCMVLVLILNWRKRTAARVISCVWHMLRVCVVDITSGHTVVLSSQARRRCADDPVSIHAPINSHKHESFFRHTRDDLKAKWTPLYAPMKRIAVTLLLFIFVWVSPDKMGENRPQLAHGFSLYAIDYSHGGRFHRRVRLILHKPNLT